MALSKNDMKTTYPLPVYNYKVEIGSDTVAFSEVSGLNIEFETCLYKESPSTSGQAGPKWFVMPAQGTPPEVTFQKGIVRDKSKSALYDWLMCNKTNLTEKKDIHIRLCDEKGDAVISWKIINAFPTVLDAPTFEADSNDVAIESLSITGDDVQLTEP